MPIIIVLIPEAICPSDPREIGRALAARAYDLTRGDIEVLELVARGLTNPEIAEQMGLREENSVKNRLRSLYSKLGVENRVQAARIAICYGFVELPRPTGHTKA